MAQPKNTPEAPQEEALEQGQHNPYLEGLLKRGAEINEAIHGWYKQRDTVRTQARGAVSAGFCSDDQATRLAELFPMPKRTKKDDATNGAAAS